jgi:hypothetical protein
LEHRFEYDGLKIADVAYIDNGDIVCIFEICNTHKTCRENRPEPWFEIDAVTLIQCVNLSTNKNIIINCIRNELCEKCIEKNVCCGDGTCLVQCDDMIYRKNNLIKCSYNCSIKKCPNKYCNKTAPEYYFNCHWGTCANCAMDGYRIYLYVPYSLKDYVKSMGAKFDGKYKKWFIKSHNDNRDLLLSKFKECNSDLFGYKRRYV